MEFPPEYCLNPPRPRPLNDADHRETKHLTDALTQAKIALGDRHAELRMMRVAVDELTKRALKAESRVKEMQAELSEQEVEKMALLQEVQALRNANFRLEKEADKNYTGYRFS